MTEVLVGCLILALVVAGALSLRTWAGEQIPAGTSAPETAPAPTAVVPVVTAAPSYAPTPAPTPISTPEPTPEPTAEPTPEPTPDPTPPSGPKDFSPAGLSAESVVNPYCLYDYTQLQADLTALEERYPQLIRVYSLGETAEGRSIPAFDFGRGDREVVLISSMHACEHIATNVVMYLTDQYCQGYQADGEWNGVRYRDILDQVTFRILPMGNPDGIELAQKGLWAVKDPDAILAMGYGEDHDFSDWKSNIRGVDLNANFSHKWGIRDEITGPCDAGWCGPGPLSEPEAQAMQKLLDDSDWCMFISLHIRGEVIYWLDTDTLMLYDAHYPIARRLSNALGYGLMGAEDVSDRGGYLVNTARVETGKFCATLELCPYLAEDPYPPDRFPDVVDGIYSLFLALGTEAINMENP